MQTLKSPINGGELKPTGTPGIMCSDYDDILYQVHEDGNIVPLKSPINGGELKLTGTPGIMCSDYDDILYHVANDGIITPIQNPDNKVSLKLISKNIYHDETTNQAFTINDGKITQIKNQEEYDRIAKLDDEMMSMSAKTNNTR